MDQRIGILYDEFMLQHRNLWDPNFPEKPDRLKTCFNSLKSLKLQDRFVFLKAKKAEDEDILRMHENNYFERVKSTNNMTEDKLMELSSLYDAVFFHPSTFECAMLAAGCTIELIKQVHEEKITHGISLVRPPGHHAMRDEANGYCIFNNVAIAAGYALDKLGLKRILIVDWDVHHGQGIQDFFYNDPRVLYFSSHRYENGTFWPYLRESEVYYVGSGHGQGYNINAPLNETEFGDSDLLAIFQQILLPVAYEFSPQLVIISCGFDAVMGDVESKSNVTPHLFGHLAHLLKPLANGHLCVVFEGGYNLKALSESFKWTVRSLQGEPLPPLALGPIKQSTHMTILRAICCLRPFWKCFAYHGNTDSDSELLNYFFDLSSTKNSHYLKLKRPEKYELIGDYEKQTEEDVALWDKKLDNMIASTKVIEVVNRTCLAYDERMKEHSCRFGHHPEQPARISSIYDKLVETGLAAKCSMVQKQSLSDKHASLVHSLDYVNVLREFEKLSEDELDIREYKYNSIYLNQKVYEIASLAAGYVLSVVDEVMNGRSLNGVAIVRPPGHHAEHDKCMGFCYFNNVAIAAKYAQSQYNVKKVLIVDWDVHHGNGSQHVFYEDSSVLFISLHRYDNGHFYPGSEEASVDYVGQGQGEGFNVNIAWNGGRMGDAEYLAAFQQVVIPLSYEFCPELVLVSCGFDAARGDPLGGYDITPEGYAHMTHMLSSLAGGKLILVLEGGYNLTSISNSMYECVSVMLGNPCPALELSTLKPTGIRSLTSVMDKYEKYWNCLKFRSKMPSKEITKSQLDAVEIERQKAYEELANIKENQKYANIEEQFAKLAVSSSQRTESKIVSEMANAASDDLPSSSHENDSVIPEAHAVIPLSYCPHLTNVNLVPASGIDAHAKCQLCDHSQENWICLSCYEVYCSRYVNSHMLDHNIKSNHPMALSFSDMSVWCYSCDSYVHNEVLMEAKNTAYQSKFPIAVD